MLLSDACVLGSTMMKLKPGNWHSCLLGSAGKAVGALPNPGRPGIVVDILFDQWPWLEANSEQYLVEIATLFDQRVCKGEMSLESLIEHIRQIEPPCACGVRECCCERVEGLLPIEEEVGLLV